MRSTWSRTFLKVGLHNEPVKKERHLWRTCNAKVNILLYLSNLNRYSSFLFFSEWPLKPLYHVLLSDFHTTSHFRYSLDKFSDKDRRISLLSKMEQILNSKSNPCVYPPEDRTPTWLLFVIPLSVQERPWPFWGSHISRWRQCTFVQETDPSQPQLYTPLLDQS